MDFIIDRDDDKPIGVQSGDDDCPAWHWLDGRVDDHGDSLDADAGGGWDLWHSVNWHGRNDQHEAGPCRAPRDTVVTLQADTFLVRSRRDARFGTQGRAPVANYQKSLASPPSLA